MDEQPKQEDRLVTSQQAAEFFSVSNETMSRARRWGTLFGMPSPPFMRFANGSVRYKMADLVHWVENNGECVHHG